MTIRADSTRVVQPLFQGEDSGSIPTSALQLRFYRIDARIAMRLNRLWHSRLPKTVYSNLIRCRRNEFYGAEAGGLWYAAAIWTDAIAENRLKDGDKLIELRRLAIAPDAPKNTASRMLGWMTRAIRKRWPDVLRLISYQDTEVHTGTIYKAAGWVAVDTRDSLTEWNIEGGRVRSAAQTAAPKIRWEKTL